jgi:hypothetical protein
MTPRVEAAHSSEDHQCLWNRSRIVTVMTGQVHGLADSTGTISFQDGQTQILPYLPPTAPTSIRTAYESEGPRGEGKPWCPWPDGSTCAATFGLRFSGFSFERSATPHFILTSRTTSLPSGTSVVPPDLVWTEWICYCKDALGKEGTEDA